VGTARRKFFLPKMHASFKNGYMMMDVAVKKHHLHKRASCIMALSKKLYHMLSNPRCSCKTSMIGEQSAH